MKLTVIIVEDAEPMTIVLEHTLKELGLEVIAKCTHGNDAIEKMRSWSSQCSWNFSNKLLLLQAESHYSLGEEKLAAEKYSQAIESARKHRFVHEEAMGCELASLFHQKMNDQDLSSSLMKRSIDCYTTWGAQKKVEALKAR